MKLLETIESFRRTEHYNVDGDCWYSCPAHPDYCGPDKGCLCGFDEHNAKVDKAAAELTALTERVRLLEIVDTNARNDYQKIADFMQSLPPEIRREYFRPGYDMVPGLIAYVAALLSPPPPAGPGDGG